MNDCQQHLPPVMAGLLVSQIRTWRAALLSIGTKTLVVPTHCGGGKLLLGAHRSRQGASRVKGSLRTKLWFG